MSKKHKYTPGDPVQMKCPHLYNGKLVVDWITGTVVQSDYRMAAVQFDRPVYTANGLPATDNILWAAHGSSRLRPHQLASPSPTDAHHTGDNP